MDASCLIGTFKQTSQSGMEQVMKAMEIPDEITKILLEAEHSYTTAANDDGSMTSIMKIGDLERSATFKIGEEFEQELLTGEKVKCIMKMDGDKLVEEQLDGKAKGKKIIIEKCTPDCGEGEGLKITISFGDATGTACVKKVA